MGSAIVRPVRSRSPRGATAPAARSFLLATVLSPVLILPTGSSAVSASAAGISAVATLAAVDDEPLPEPTPITELSLSEARERVSETEVALRVVVLQKQTDDRALAGSKLAVEELRSEMRAIADTTVRSAITNYRQTDLDAGLLEIQDLNAGLRANALGDAAIVADTKTFAEYRDKAKDLELAEANLSAEIEENEGLTAQVATLQKQLESEQSWLAELEERELQRTTREYSVTESGWAQARGNKQGFYLLTCPVDGRHTFIDSWGFPRSGGRRHKGVDILAATGTPIVAPVDGRVEYRSNRVGGRSFHLWAENGNYFYGTHMSGYGRTDGEVRAGQVIGYVGDDGNAAGTPHLHFEIHPGRRGNQINPFQDTAAVCDGAMY